MCLTPVKQLMNVIVYDNSETIDECHCVSDTSETIDECHCVSDTSETMNVIMCMILVK